MQQGWMRPVLLKKILDQGWMQCAGEEFIERLLFLLMFFVTVNHLQELLPVRKVYVMIETLPKI